MPKTLTKKCAERLGSVATLNSNGNNILYAITIKPTLDSYKKSVTESLLLRLCKILKIELTFHRFEKDSDDLLHLHGSFLARKNLYLKKYRKKGWHIWIVPIWDNNGWTGYSSKGDIPANQYYKSQTADIRKINSQYSFIEQTAY